MKTKRYSTEQIIGILKEAEAGLPVKELCRKHGVSDATIYNWKSKFGDMTVSDARRLKELEVENQRLKQLVADQALDNRILKEIVSKKS
jgi:putative transposase